MDDFLLCTRPGCQGIVAAWLTYDYTTQRVWLDDEPSAGGNPWALCADHAGRLSPPRGWEQLDRRRQTVPAALGEVAEHLGAGLPPPARSGRAT